MSQANIRIAGNVSLDPVQSASLEMVSRDVPGVLGVVAMPNVQKIESSSVLPSGTVICVRADAQLDVSLLPNNMFSVIALYPIIKAKNTEDLDDEYFRSRMSVEKGRRIAEGFGAGPSLSTTDLVGMGGRIGRDTATWKPMLGTGFWAICQHEREKYDSRYYVAVYVPKTQLSTEFLDRVTEIAQSDAHTLQHSTFKHIHELPEYHTATRLARRNASKIALQVASAFSVVVQHTVDTDALVSPTTLTQPMIALPHHITQFNHFDRVKVGTKTSNGTRYVDSVAIYNGCGSLNESSGGMVVPVSPRLGIDLYPNVKRVLNHIRNGAVNAVPQGRATDGVRSLRQPDLRFNENHVFWESKRGKAVHPKMKLAYRVESDTDVDQFMPHGADEEKLRLEHVIEYLGEAQITPS